MHITELDEKQVGVIISANAEWKTVLKFFNDPTVQQSPFGSFFSTILGGKSAVIFQGGWGKISAAAGTQYLIDRWNPGILVNIGTCGGLADKAKVGDILLVNQTIVYDIIERMSDPSEARNFYSTQLDLSFLQEPYPQNVIKNKILSADQDIDPALVEMLIRDYGAVAADWESGAIAWTAERNHTNCVILRTVSDLVNKEGGEIYDSDEFHSHAEKVMTPILKALPNWIRCMTWGLKK